MISFDGIIFSSRNKRGGVAVYFKELIGHAVQGGHDVRILVHDPTFEAAEVRCRPEQLVFRSPRVLERFRALRKLPAGVLHSSYYRICPQRNVRNVITVYDFTYEKFSPFSRALLHTRQKREAIMRADAVICISENTRRDLHEFIPECPRNKVSVTHLAAGDPFKPLSHTTITITTRPFVLFVGGRAGYKNFSTALQAVQLTKECALVCIGGGPFSAAERAALDAALPGRHFHAGPVGAAALNEIYNAAVCLVYPSLYEGFGIPPLEAMKAGCPFVALNRSSIPEVAGEAGILLNDSDARLMAAAIEECVNSHRRAQLRVLGFAQAEKFSWRNTFAATSPVYQRLLSS